MVRTQQLPQPDGLIEPLKMKIKLVSVVLKAMAVVAMTLNYG